MISIWMAMIFKNKKCRAIPFFFTLFRSTEMQQDPAAIPVHI
jgi:hypothetical protein